MYTAPAPPIICIVAWVCINIYAQFLCSINKQFHFTCKNQDMYLSLISKQHRKETNTSEHKPGSEPAWWACRPSFNTDTFDLELLVTHTKDVAKAGACKQPE